jgi:hypothetical protein
LNSHSIFKAAWPRRGKLYPKCSEGDQSSGGYRSSISGCCGGWHNQQHSQGDEFRLDLRPSYLQAFHLGFEGIHRKSGISRSIPDKDNLFLFGVVQKDLAIKIMHLGA